MTEQIRGGSTLEVLVVAEDGNLREVPLGTLRDWRIGNRNTADLPGEIDKAVTLPFAPPEPTLREKVSREREKAWGAKLKALHLFAQRWAWWILGAIVVVAALVEAL